MKLVWCKLAERGTQIKQSRQSLLFMYVFSPADVIDIYKSRGCGFPLVDTRLYEVDILQGTQVEPFRQFHLGQPLSLRWRAPSGHSRADWIGIYAKNSQLSHEITTISSQKRWLGVFPHEWEGDIHITLPSVHHEAQLSSDEGVCKFVSADRLPNNVGLFEARFVLQVGFSCLRECTPTDIIMMGNTKLWQ